MTMPSVFLTCVCVRGENKVVRPLGSNTVAVVAKGGGGGEKKDEEDEGILTL